ncbi:MAG: hypothetical protein ACRDVN_10580 [Jiangellaceae bacterium]
MPDARHQSLEGQPREVAAQAIAPVLIDKRLFDDIDETVILEHLRLLQSPFATHVTHRVVR